MHNPVSVAGAQKAVLIIYLTRFAGTHFFSLTAAKSTPFTTDLLRGTRCPSRAIAVLAVRDHFSFRI